jgi:hypothetical protein
MLFTSFFMRFGRLFAGAARIYPGRGQFQSRWRGEADACYLYLRIDLFFV